MALANANEIDPPTAVWNAMLLCVHDLRINVVRLQCIQGFQDCTVILTTLDFDEARNVFQHEDSGFLLFQVVTDMPEDLTTPPSIRKTLLQTSC
eukprot:CAMPEP_0172704920 /NCGR_PEP_ID=MMETSP1074-20121228/42015_1 /TAXON_ID=2916 /ORGANISM="Ceratium fusus, Strain PA161109" /LENGTH=93 /DNA_ID=CAMNT_0013527167 /DNA_START=305 /DNA_END=586 /DNA_ORIENTATION=-